MQSISKLAGVFFTSSLTAFITSMKNKAQAILATLLARSAITIKTALATTIAVAIAIAIAVAHCPQAAAGVFEVSGSGSWRKSSFDKYNYNEMTSWTGSFSYYFMEMSALELSYTDGVNRQSVKPQGDSQVLTVTNFQLTALDLVITLAEKEDTFQPYFKLGGGYLNKSIFNQIEGFGMKNAGNVHGWVPSAGVGLKWFLTKDFSIRLGLDAWTSPPNQQPVVVDYAGRAGLSILL